MTIGPARPNRLQNLLAGAVVIAAFATVPLIVLLERSRVPDWVRVADWVIWSIFLLDFLVCSFEYLSRQSGGKNLLLLATVVILSFPLFPAITAVVRLARAATALRFLLLGGVVLEMPVALGQILGRSGVVYVVCITSFLVLAGGSALSILEPDKVQGGLGEGVWWAVMTATAVGYTDIAPVTIWGRAIAVVLVLAGMGLISTLAASVTSYFISQEANELKDLIVSNQKLVARLNQQLARMEERHSLGEMKSLSDSDGASTPSPVESVNSPGVDVVAQPATISIDTSSV